MNIDRAQELIDTLRAAVREREKEDEKYIYWIVDRAAVAGLCAAGECSPVSGGRPPAG